MSINDKAKSLKKLEIIGTIEEQCVKNTAVELAEFISNNFAVDIGANDNKVIIGNSAPSPDSRGDLWVRLDDNRNFLGLYLYNGQEREWLSVTPLPTQEARIYWKFDPTRNLADLPKGYVLDEDSLLARDQKKDGSGRIVYAWIRPATAKR